MKINLKTGSLNLFTEDENKLKKENTFASRNNIKRGFVFLSKVLGKHYPVKPKNIFNKNYELSKELLSYLDENETVFIGFAETATLISENIYEQVCNLNIKNSHNYVYQHTTRYLTSNKISLKFLEEHCHAPSHILYELKDKEKKEIALNSKKLVLIDDEISTGKTFLNILKELLHLYKKIENVYIVSLLNFVSRENLSLINKFEKENNIKITTIYSIKGEFNFEYNPSYFKNFVRTKSVSDYDEELIKFNGDKLLGNNDSGRFGNSHNDIDLKNFFTNEDIEKFKNKKILVLGTGEFMYKPFLLAKKLEDLKLNIKYQTTTRSPLLKGYGVKSVLSFKDNYFENIDNFLYNVIDKNYDYIFICYETNILPKEHNLKKLLENFMLNLNNEIVIKNLFL